MLGRIYIVTPIVGRQNKILTIVHAITPAEYKLYRFISMIFIYLVIIFSCCSSSAVKKTLERWGWTVYLNEINAPLPTQRVLVFFNGLEHKVQPFNERKNKILFWLHLDIRTYAYLWVDVKFWPNFSRT